MDFLKVNWFQGSFFQVREEISNKLVFSLIIIFVIVILMSIYVRGCCSFGMVGFVCLVYLICMVIGFFLYMYAFFREEVIGKEQRDVMKGMVIRLCYKLFDKGGKV